MDRADALQYQTGLVALGDCKSRPVSIIHLFPLQHEGAIMRLNDLEFFQRRQQLFRHAPCEGFDLGQTAEALNWSKNLRPTVAATLAEADRLLIQPRSGVSDHLGMIRLLRG